MKRIGILFLSALLCVHGVWADGDDIDVNHLDPEKMDQQYLAGLVDLETAYAWCTKIMQYAKAHHIRIEFEKGVIGNMDMCDDLYNVRDKGNLGFYAVWAAQEIVKIHPAPHSQCVQNQIEEYARLHCGDTSLANPIVECSNMDSRCVVARQNQNGDMNVSCCVIPDIKCTTSDVKIKGNISIPWTMTLSDIPKLDTFDYGCYPIQTQNVDDDTEDLLIVLDDDDDDEIEISDEDVCREALEQEAVKYMSRYTTNYVDATCSMDENYCVVNMAAANGDFTTQCLKTLDNPAMQFKPGNNFSEIRCEVYTEFAQPSEQYSGVHILDEFDRNCNKTKSFM